MGHTALIAAICLLPDVLPNVGQQSLLPKHFFDPIEVHSIDRSQHRPQERWSMTTR
jgi:hypothetical protein